MKWWLQRKAKPRSCTVLGGGGTLFSETPWSLLLRRPSSRLHESIKISVLMAIGQRLLEGGGVYRSLDPWHRLSTPGPRLSLGRAGLWLMAKVWTPPDPDTLIGSAKSIPPEDLCTCYSRHEPPMSTPHFVVWLIPFCHLGSQPKCHLLGEAFSDHSI